jgi:ribonuclease HI
LKREECQAQIKGYSGARYKKFTNAEEAEEYAAISSSKSPSKRTSAIQTTIQGRPSPSKTKSGRARAPDMADERGWDVVYCDGACKGNGQVGSVAGIGVWWGKNHPGYQMCGLHTSVPF